MRKKRAATIFRRLFLPIFALMLLQSTIYYVFTVSPGGIVATLDRNEEDILSERVASRRSEIESQFNARWTNLSLCSDTLDTLYDQYVDTHNTPLYREAQDQREFLLDASTPLLAMLRSNSVNGVFLILNNSAGYQPLDSARQSLYGLCIRDYDLTSGYTDKEDLLLARSPSVLTAALGCSLDSYWEAVYTFSADDPGDFYYKPLQAAYDNPGVSSDNLSYFCGPHAYSEGDREVVSYSIPLIGSDGTIYGVLGVELLTSYLSSLLPSDELAGQSAGSYLLVQHHKGSSDYQVVASSGTLFQRCFGSVSSFTLPRQNDPHALLSYTGKQGISVRCSESALTIYNRNTPYEDEVFSLMGVMSAGDLYSVSRTVRNSLLMVTLVVLVIGSLGIFVVSHFLTRPIKRLAQSVRTMTPEADVELQHINIKEIDQLVDSIVDLNQKVSQTQVRTEFFSRMSHDMRTPMNAVIGFSSPEVAAQSSREQLLEDLEKINGSGKYLLGLINEVLDMTKIDSGRMELECRSFSTAAFWADALPMIDELASQRNIRFVKDLPAPSDEYVIGDEQRLSQVVINLLSNAVKFTAPGGTVTLTVRETQTPEGRIAFRISVRDTGVGMSEAFQKKLYQPFAQEHSNREGTGLGLSIAHQLVSLMGGTICCESALGKGTEFIVAVELPPAAAESAPALPGQSFSGEELLGILHGKRILLCEDHPLNRQIACRLLEKEQMLVEMAENGELGVEKFSCSPPGYYAAVLMDIRMPVMDGLTAAQTIRSRPRPDAKTIPILAMTANAFKEDVSASAEAGMNAHLSKPIEPQKLYQTLAACIADAEKDP